MMLPLSHTVTVTWKDPRQSEVVRNALCVDKDRHPESARERITVDGAALTITVEASDYRILRMQLSTLYDNLILAARTINAFA